ncbi:MAG: GAF domain-containing protein [Calothrix sp. FI2-JRJ7]|jgi:GAF domain-containing protein|nr:GAF domain-containing protein [Calothrix sp. FI2-JRJ7]
MEKNHTPRLTSSQAPTTEQYKNTIKLVGLIHKASDQKAVFETVVKGLRQILYTDRVAIFCYKSDLTYQGEFVYEDVGAVWMSVLHTKVNDSSLAQDLIEIYEQGEIQVLSNIDQDYIEFLDKFQVHACIIAPLFKNDKLWGLLCVHQCSEVRQWQDLEIEIVKQVVEHLEVALQNIELLAQAPSNIEKEKTLAAVIARIRESLDLQTIFKNTATEVRQLLQADRVGVFRFYPHLDWEGEFVSEDVANGWNSAMALKIHDHCFSEQFAAQYQEGKLNIITDIYQGDCSPCHIAILEKFQVRSNLVAPLLKGKKLWGLLCIHQCSAPRYWEESEIEFIQQIAVQLSVAIQQAEYLEQMQMQAVKLAQASERERIAERQKSIAKTIEKIRQTFDLETIFHTATHEIRKILEADRVVIYRFNPDWSGDFVVESIETGWNSLLDKQLQQPELRANISECSIKLLVNAPIPDSYLKETQGGRFVRGEIFRTCDDIYNAGFSDCYIRVLESYQARAYAIVAIYHGNKLWGLLAVFQNSAPRKWEDDEICLLTQISTQLGTAFQQAEYFQQVSSQAAQLEKAAERQRALATTVDKIRQSLDIESIFQATTQEVRRLLNVERVAIYRFYPDWSGEFVADSILDGWTPVGKSQPTIEKTFLEAAKTGKYPRNETFVPILQGEKLWGLLVAYQNSQPRYWEEEEVNLLAQVGVQLGVALQQAETLKQVQAQAAQLTRAAEREKALATTVEKIRQSLDLHTIFATTTQEVRNLLKVERVAIYSFYTDGSGDFVAESVASEWMPLIGNSFLMMDTFVQKALGELNMRLQKTITVDDIYKQQYSDPQLVFLEQIQARAYVMVPIFQGDNLWGLLAAYQNTKPREWMEDEVSLLAQIGLQLAVALQQAELLEQTRLQKEKLNEALKELQRTQTQLIQGEKMAGLGQLVAGIAHEINNPINFIYGNLSHVSEYTQSILELMKIYQHQYPEPVQKIQAQASKIDLDYIIEDLPKTILSMHSGAERILQLVESLRTFSRLDHAQIKHVDIHGGIDSALLILQHRLRSSANTPPIDVIKRYGDLPLVECYAALLNQVFMNILINAIDAIEIGYKQHQKENSKKLHSPQIIIHSQVVQNDRVLIRIHDNGCGIPDDVVSRIFDPFFTTKEPGKGTGLGLSISYQIIVEKHGGKIECFCEPGKGTEFWIEIPIKHSMVPT